MNELTKPEKKQAKKKPTVSKEIAEEVARIAAEAAVKAYEEKRKADLEERDKKKFHNTKLLLQKYRWLRQYSDNAIYSLDQLSPEEDEVLGVLGLCPGEAKRVESIKNGLVFTRIIMTHVESMLGCYERTCKKSKKQEVQRRWRIIEKMYLSSTIDTAQNIADMEHISLSQVYYDIDNACEDLKQLFFGLDISLF